MFIRSNETILETAKGAFNRDFYLVHVAAGIEIAGSGTREQHECYRVLSSLNGTRHSQAFKTKDEAQSYFSRFTTPIVAIEA